jgi:hypothetical protein
MAFGIVFFGVMAHTSVLFVQKSVKDGIPLLQNSEGLCCDAIEDPGKGSKLDFCPIHTHLKHH